jgi:hypothetical protein
VGPTPVDLGKDAGCCRRSLVRQVSPSNWRIAASGLDLVSDLCWRSAVRQEINTREPIVCGEPCRRALDQQRIDAVVPANAVASPMLSSSPRLVL